MRKISIQTKIVLPFTILFAVVIAISTLITITLTYRQVDARIEAEMNRLANALLNTGSALSPDFLANVKRAVGIEITVYDKELKTVASTLSSITDQQTLGAQIRSQLSEVSPSALRPPPSKLQYQNKSYQLIFRRFQINEPSSNHLLVLMMPTFDIQATKKRVAFSMLIVACLAILLVGGVGHMIAKNLTAPIKDLLELTTRVAGGDLEYEGKIRSPDEIGELTEAFNQMTKQLKLFQKQLVESERLAMAGQMAAAFAHDIRNPLSSIKMIVQLLKKKLPPDDENEKYIQAILDEVNRLDARIKSRLDLIRPINSASPIELQLQNANLNYILIELIGLMEANMLHHHIELEKSFDTSISSIKLDFDRIKQAFMNIILNSIQAMPNGGKLTISSGVENDAMSVKITDTGVGMSKETREHLFTAFYTTKEGGTGLGLLNAKRAIEQHGGSIEVSSELGVGTKVKVRLPLEKGREAGEQRSSGE